MPLYEITTDRRPTKRKTTDKATNQHKQTDIRIHREVTLPLKRYCLNWRQAFGNLMASFYLSFNDLKTFRFFPDLD